MAELIVYLGGIVLVVLCYIYCIAKVLNKKD